MKKYLIGGILLINSIVLLASNEEYFIKKIEFNGLVDIPESVLLRNLKYKAGTVYSADKILIDYQNLSKNKYLDEASMHSEEYNGGIKLVIDVKEKENVKELLSQDGIVPISERESIDTSLVIGQIDIVGNLNISTDEIKKIIDLKDGEYLSRNKLKRAVDKLAATGLYGDIKYDIYNLGGSVAVSFFVEENPIINDIIIEGNTKFKTEDLEKLSSITMGEILDNKKLGEFLQKLDEKYKEAGYVLTQIKVLGIIDGDKIKIGISEGKINKVSYAKMVTKQRSGRRSPTDTILKTKDFVIEREIEIKPDEVFNIQKYNETFTNLMRTGFFKNVKYEVKDAPDGEKELLLLLEEERTASLQASLSYGSEIGFLGMLALKDINWLGNGQNVGITFEKSDEDYMSFSLDFSDPWIRGTDRISWGWSLYKTQYENDDSVLFNETDIYGLKADIGRGLNKYVRFGLGAKAEYITEKPKSAELESAINYATGAYKQELEKYRGKRELWLYSLSPSIVYDSRNNYWNPTAGGYAKFQVEVGYATSTEQSFASGTLELRKYLPGFFKKNSIKFRNFEDMENTFAFRLIGGIMTTSTPESQRFWVGGGGTLRGYDGGYFRGTREMIFTVENRTQINDILGFVVFSDIGRAWQYDGIDPGYLSLNRDAHFPDKMAYTAGFGLRIKTPMGPLRFDFGWPIGDRDNTGMKFYFSMGQSF